MSTICQHFNTIDVEVCYTRNREGCGGCEEEQSFWKLYIQWVFGTVFYASICLVRGRYNNLKSSKEL